ncbi:cysteine desulfurase [Candidatus Parcubacteria bacterium]|nr:cysteine desulfurase [Candidatus Parcubacteria bacterium]
MFSGLFKKKSKRIYLDFAAATPVHPDVFRAMEPYFTEEYGNPSAIHQEGVRARNVVEGARADTARTLRVRAGDVTFTSGGTEANNLAILGTVDALHSGGLAHDHMEVVSTRIEHPSIIETMRVLADRGVRVVYVPVDEDGRILQKDFEEVLSKKTVLVVVSYVNSEIGVVQDIKKISRTVRKFNEEHEVHIRTLVDAAQAPLWLPCQVDALGVDLLTLDSGKCYGPKGVGVLVHRGEGSLSPQTFGGSQESGLRAGTENVSLIVGCAAALKRAQEGVEVRVENVQKVRDAMLAYIEREIPDAVVNGSQEHRVANNLNISLPGLDSEFAVIVLDTHGVATSTRSACSGADGSGSYVVREIADEARATSTVRFTLGEETTQADVRHAVDILKEHVQAMKKFQAK